MTWSGALGHASPGGDAAALVLAPTVAGVALLAYLLRTRTLARRGRGPGGVRTAAFAAGLVVAVLAVVPPLDGLADERLSAHMGQHLLLLDAAPLLLLWGLDRPLLRPLLALPGVRALRRVGPTTALLAWLGVLAAWHVPGAYGAAVEHPALHALEHASFLLAGLLVWASLLETLPQPAWFGHGVRLGSLAVVRIAGFALGSVLLWADAPLYGVYAGRAAEHGVDALADQRLAGGLMVAEGGVLTLAAAALVFLRLLAAEDRRTRLLEAGVPPAAAARASRYGRS